MSDQASQSIDLSRISAETPVERVHWFDKVNSTNDAATGHTGPASTEPELFITDRQLAGRGRSGADWWGGPGSLTFSLLTHKPNLPVEKSPLVSLAVGLAICRAVEHYLPASPVRVKWPNDVFVDGLKVCGILIEAPGEAPEQLVIGVGLNVNNQVAEAPSELQKTATSLLDALSRSADQPLDRTEVLITCLNQILLTIEQLTDAPHSILQQLRSRCLVSGRRVRVETQGRAIAGICGGIGADGSLRVQTPKGEIPCFGGTVTQIE